jgi:hypothetical protein
MLSPVSEDLFECFVDSPTIKSLFGCQPTYIEERLEGALFVSLDPEYG